MRVFLTDRFCIGAKARGKAQVDYFDEREAGLALRVSSAGRKAWTLHFTSPKDGKRARLQLGLYPQTSLAAARTAALEAKGHLEKGVDPRDAMAAIDASAMTVAALVPLYLEKPHKRTGQPRRTIKEIGRRFAVNVVPVIGSVKLADLHRRDIQRTVAPILRRQRPMEAARTFEDLRALIRWGVGQGYLDRNVAEGMETPAKSPPRERVLSEAEINTLWHGLPRSLARSKACQRIVKLCLVTAQRVGEVAGMRRNELDLKAATWTIPAGRTKNGFAHQVPLSPLAVALIEEALADADERFVFPAGSGSLSATAVARTVARAHEGEGRFGIGHWTTHDLRRSAVSMMAELGVSPIVLGHVINHRSVTRAGVTLAVYQHYQYDKEKRQALELWAGRVESAVSERDAAEIVSLGTRKKNA